MSNQGFKRFINMLAFLGLCLVAFAMLLAQVLQWIGVTASVLSAIRMVGECIAYIVTAIYAFSFVRSKRNIWWWVAYIVAVVVVVLLIIL